jgi:hypothetical protein
MSKATLPRQTTKVPAWLNPRRPVLFIAQGALVYACAVTLGQALWEYFAWRITTVFFPREMLERFAANCLAGLAVAFFFWYRTKSNLSMNSLD